MAIYLSDPWIRTEDIASCKVEYPFDLVRSFDIQHMFDPSKQKYQRTTTVADLTVDSQEKLETIQSPWGACKDY